MSPFFILDCKEKATRRVALKLVEAGGMCPARVASTIRSSLGVTLSHASGPPLARSDRRPTQRPPDLALSNRAVLFRPQQKK